MAQGNNIEGFTAVGYVRISDADQSTFSIEGQAAGIRDFCKRHNIELQQVFADEGRSGSNFDREGWRELEKTVKASRQKINGLLLRNPLQISNLALETAAENSDDFQKNQVSTPYGALNELLEIVSRAA